MDDKNNKIYQMMVDASVVKVKKLQKLIEDRNNAKTKTKKDYLEKKMEDARSEAIKYMMETDKIRKKLEENNDI